MKRLLFMLLVAVISMTGAESIGATISDTQPYDFLGSSGSTSLIFSPFDDAGGTLILESVTLLLDTSQIADITVENSSKSNDGDVTVNLTSQVSASLDTILATINIFASDGPVYIPTAATGPGGGLGEGHFDINGTGSSSDVATLDLSGFIGSGDLTVSIDGTGVLETTGGEGTYTIVENSFTTSGDVTIVYEYSQVPEPATLSILALGAGMMFYVRRR